MCEEHRMVMRMPRVQRKARIRRGESINGALHAHRMRMRIAAPLLRLD
jgi:hypothetical protein